METASFISSGTVSVIASEIVSFTSSETVSLITSETVPFTSSGTVSPVSSLALISVSSEAMSVDLIFPSVTVTLESVTGVEAVSSSENKSTTSISEVVFFWLVSPSDSLSSTSLSRSTKTGETLPAFSPDSTEPCVPSVVSTFRLFISSEIDPRVPA